MAKGDDAIAKHRNKAIRKRNRRVGADTLEAIQGVQAAKRRRKAGVRRVCEGMCFALPTPEDPFLEKRDLKLKAKKKREAARTLALSKEPVVLSSNGTYKGKEYQGGEDRGQSDEDVSAGYQKSLKVRKRKDSLVGTVELVELRNKTRERNGESRRKVLMNGLASGKESKVKHVSLDQGGMVFVGGKSMVRPNMMNVGINNVSLIAADEVLQAVLLESGLKKAESSLGQELENEIGSNKELVVRSWEGYRLGRDVLVADAEDHGCGLLAPCAAEVRSRKLKDDVSQGPIALIMVGSKEDALRVRSVFRTVKQLTGISSVCLHDGTSFSRQVDELRRNIPDVVVATPDRLCELLSSKAVTLSGVSFFAVYNLAKLLDVGSESVVYQVAEQVEKASRKVVITCGYPEKAASFTRRFLAQPVFRVVLDESLKHLSITQSISVFTKTENRIKKMVTIAQLLATKKTDTNSLVVFVEDAKEAQAVASELLKLGLRSATLLGNQKLDVILKQFSEGLYDSLVSIREHTERILLQQVRTVVNYCFPHDIEVYKKMLNLVARQSADGVIHSFCTASMVSSASKLIELLQECLQDVPPGLQMLADAASLVQQRGPT